MSDEIYRILLLKGVDGIVGCRVWGELSQTIPNFLDGMRIKCASRAIGRMRNVVAVRGKPGSSMIGPMDYFQDIEHPHSSYWICSLKKRRFERRGEMCLPSPLANEKEEIDEKMSVKCVAEWRTGESEFAKETVPSLFSTYGTLYLNRETILFHRYDYRNTDLSEYKAELVRNDTPFMITKRPPKNI